MTTEQMESVVEHVSEVLRALVPEHPLQETDAERMKQQARKYVRMVVRARPRLRVEQIEGLTLRFVDVYVKARPQTHAEQVDNWAKRVELMLELGPRWKCPRPRSDGGGGCDGRGKVQGRSADDLIRCEFCKGEGSYPNKGGYAMWGHEASLRLEECKHGGFDPPAALIAVIKLCRVKGRKQRMLPYDTPRWALATRLRAANPRWSFEKLAKEVTRAFPKEPLSRSRLHCWSRDNLFSADVASWKRVADDLREHGFRESFRAEFIEALFQIKGGLHRQ